MELDSSDWLRLTRLWGELSEHPHDQLDAAAVHLLATVREMTGCDESVLLLAVRDPTVGPDDPIDGFRPTAPLWPDLDAARAAVLAQWQRDVEPLETDPLSVELMKRHGAPRSYLRQELVSDTRWDSSYSRQIWGDMEISDRINAACPLTEDLELLVCVDRRHRGAWLGARERDLLLAAVSGLAPFGRAFARMLGLLDANTRLTPRERQILQLLLRGDSEKAIAWEIGLAYGTVHQYVVSIYRKFEVSSRGELMALWLGRKP